MIDFDPILDQQHVVRQQTPVIVETVTLTPVRTVQPAGWVGKPADQWTWEDLRDYVVRQIEERHGPQVRDFKKESGIFKGFLSRWTSQAPVIAQMAFDVYDGMWRGAPISVNRFCKASDPFFAQVIADRL